MRTVKRPTPVELRLLGELDVRIETIIRSTRGFDVPDRRIDWIQDNAWRLRRASRELQRDLSVARYRTLPVDGLVGEPDDEVPGDDRARIHRLAIRWLEAHNFEVSESRLQDHVGALPNTHRLTERELWALGAILRLACFERLVALFPVRYDSVGPSASLNTSCHTDLIGALVQSLATIDNIDWSRFVAETSAIEGVLGEDPAGVYRAMCERTRNRYRGEVEVLARWSSLSEAHVAERLVALAGAAGADSDAAHVGHWLLDAGRLTFERMLDVRLPARVRLRRVFARRARVLYGLALALSSGLAWLVPMTIAHTIGASFPVVVSIAILSWLPASVLAIAWVNLFVSRIVAPRTLPSMDPRAGVPAGCDTAVVIPVIVDNKVRLARWLEALETRYLANRDIALRWILLSDHADHDGRTAPGDAAIERSLSDGIERLERRYGDGKRRRFFLLHRARRFNPAEGCWMGEERKRGKLEAFNDLVTSGSTAAFSRIVGDPSELGSTRFVITLDADTALPPETAVRLVCKMAHPLNAPRRDRTTGRLVAGYNILQPRIEALVHGESMSSFATLFAGDGAIDIYSRAVSDVYQDAFDVGIYTGKGIYDVADFRTSLEGRVPKNRILSHDLFEGLHGRVGLVTDIVLYERYPETWREYSSRQHRWIRGDWQLLPWLASRVPAAGGERIASRFDRLGRWMVADNLRRSLVAPGLLAWFLAAWLWWPGSPLLWTALGLGAFLPYLLDDAFAAVSTASRGRRPVGRGHGLARQSARVALALVFLPADALVAVDAIGRSLWRLFVSRRHLLEWTSAEQTRIAEHAQTSTRERGRWLWPGSALAPLLGLYLAITEPGTLAAAMPLLVIWCLAPWIAARLGRPRRFRRESLSDHDRVFLRGVARRTWHFFETFVGPDDHWIPPDNFQRSPVRRLARRTSPTNIGLYLASVACARDLGFIGTSEVDVRCRYALDTIEMLEHFRGHLLNWYDTETCAALEPRYVSTVDSGNLAVALISVSAACVELAERPAISTELIDGIDDTLRLIDETVLQVDTNPADPLAAKPCVAVQADREAARHDLQLALDELRRLLVRGGVLDCRQRLRTIIDTLRLRYESALLPARADDVLIPHQHDDALSNLTVWVERFDHQLHTLARDIDRLMPWVAALERVPEAHSDIVHRLSAAWPIDTPLRHAGTARDRARATLEIDACAFDSATGFPDWLTALEASLDQAYVRQQALAEGLRENSRRCLAVADAMRFDWLYDRRRRLFRIGYTVSSASLDANHYDLLASEARMASLFAIARNQVPLEHWFALGRPIVRTTDATGWWQVARPTAQSWSGSMFEYLMPALFMPAKRGTFLGESESAAVIAQQRHALRRCLPWGVSESAFAETDADGNYQYRAFGVPALGIRRDRGIDRVVAPYASLLALGVWPALAVENLRRLRAFDALDTYGYVDALDFTPSRDRLAGPAIVDTWMAHHQGMSLVAIGNVLQADRSARRVMSHPHLRAVALLLHERVPWSATAETIDSSQDEAAMPSAAAMPGVSWSPPPDTELPQLHLLGDDSLNAHVTREGAGSLFARGCALTRPMQAGAGGRLDGYRIHVRDDDWGDGFRLGDPPQGTRPAPNVTFSDHSVDTVQHLDALVLRLEVWIAPDLGEYGSVDIRRIRIENGRQHACRVRFFSSAEVVIAPPEDHERHPAFSKLFVESHAVPSHHGLLFTRRALRPEHPTPVLLHRLVSDDPHVSPIGMETDRLCWLGRLGEPGSPRGVSRPLSGTTGFTLDPVMVIGVEVELDAGAHAEFAFATLSDESKELLLARSTRLTPETIDRSRQHAAHAALRDLSRSGLAAERLPHIQALLSRTSSADRARPPGSPDDATRGPQQPELWSVGLSGDRPIIVVRADDETPRDVLATFVCAQSFWRRRGFRIDLLILHRGPSGYDAALRARVLDVIRETGSHGWFGRDGGVHLVSVAAENIRIARAVELAAAILIDANESIDSMLVPPRRIMPPLPRIARYGSGSRGASRADDAGSPDSPAALEFENGLGGFEPETGDYHVHLPPGRSTPAPWCNVLANADFGTIVSEAGLGFTWAANSGEHRLTRWSCDPVADTPSEMLWLRDVDRAEIWSPLPRPPFHHATVGVRHGAGWTDWSLSSHALDQTLSVAVPPDAPVKLVRMRIGNRGGEHRRIDVTYAVEWILGALPSRAKPQVRAWCDGAVDAVLANSAWDPTFADRVAFLAASRPADELACEWREFLGIRGDPLRPEALERDDLRDRDASGGEAGGIVRVRLDLPAGSTRDVCFILGEGLDHGHALALLTQWRATDAYDRATDALATLWRGRFDAVQVRTPDRGFDLMVNRWLPYQTWSSRVHARAGFYQASGAYGFRDQLQDVLSLLATDSGAARQQILDAAARQFEAGDVLHWWHPPQARGVRTRFSDDRLWLPFALARYLVATGDRALLDEVVPFLHADELADDEHDRYAVYQPGADASLFEHGARAIERGMHTGAHGLPFIGSGDWNDGMDRIGSAGRGESLWLAWFRIVVARAYAPIAEARGETYRARRWRTHADELETAIDRQGWDGAWFVRAFDDAGKPWGSASCDECRIDAIAQAWAAIADYTNRRRVREALDSADRELIDRDHAIVRLLTPPFHATPRDPGYIKAYPPGVRENGGQYSHGACWLGLAFAIVGDGTRAHEVFDMVSPVRRARTAEGCNQYRREPYVVSADIGGAESSTGIGGWSWYTGASGWAWQLAVRGILGIEHVPGGIRVAPSLPQSWAHVAVRLTSTAGVIAIEYLNPHGAPRGVTHVTIDGSASRDAFVAFPGAGRTRDVRLTVGENPRDQRHPA